MQLLFAPWPGSLMAVIKKPPPAIGVAGSGFILSELNYI